MIGDHRTCRGQRSDQHPNQPAQKGTDKDLARHDFQQGRRRGGFRRQDGTDDWGQDQRNHHHQRQTDTRRDINIPKSGHQHDGRSEPGNDQDKGINAATEERIKRHAGNPPLIDGDNSICHAQREF